MSCSGWPCSSHLPSWGSLPADARYALQELVVAFLLLLLSQWCFNWKYQFLFLEGECKKTPEGLLQRNGLGVHTSANGMIYIGNWLNDKVILSIPSFQTLGLECLSTPTPRCMERTAITWEGPDQHQALHPLGNPGKAQPERFRHVEYLDTLLPPEAPADTPVTVGPAETPRQWCPADGLRVHSGLHTAYLCVFVLPTHTSLDQTGELWSSVDTPLSLAVLGYWIPQMNY